MKGVFRWGKGISGELAMQQCRHGKNMLK